jgi:tRNA pseudouridine55 synthase
MTGILLVDKPRGVTSHDVVDAIRKAAGQRKVGHTGTLDPAATGLLILCLGKATRLSEHLTGMDKVYEGAMRLGLVTDSYDLDGETVEECPVPKLDCATIQEACSRYTGDIEQVPPMVSAVKIGGERLYKRARKGEVVDRPARKVQVHVFDVLDYTPPEARVRVHCTSGTYVRSLCHDVGQALGCGAVLASLRRTHVGNHCVDQAATMASFTTPESVRERLISMGTALDLPEVIAGTAARAMLVSGSPITTRSLEGGCPVAEGWVQIKGERGELLALGVIEPSAAGARIQPKRVFL